MLNVLQFVDTVNSVFMRNLISMAAPDAATFEEIMSWEDGALQARFSGAAQYLKAAQKYGLLHYDGEMPQGRLIRTCSLTKTRRDILSTVLEQPQVRFACFLPSLHTCGYLGSWRSYYRVWTPTHACTLCACRLLASRRHTLALTTMQSCECPILAFLHECAPTHFDSLLSQLVGSSMEPQRLRMRILGPEYTKEIHEFLEGSFEELFPNHAATQEVERELWARRMSHDHRELAERLGMTQDQFQAYLVDKAKEAFSTVSGEGVSATAITEVDRGQLDC
jgi:hypothetical protein